MTRRSNETVRRPATRASAVAAVTLAALLPLLAASPAAAGPRGQEDMRGRSEEPRNDAATSVIALAVRVTDLSSGATATYKIAPPPAEQVPMQVGQRVRVELTGTAIVDGRGVAVDVPASFEVASGAWRIDMAPAADNAVTVTARSPNSDRRHDNPDSRSSLSYQVTGRFDMKPAMRDGRITFDIAPGEVVAGSDHPDDDRWNRAAEIADALSYIRLDRRPMEQTFVEMIYDQGARGIHDVASRLAVEMERSGNLDLWQRDALLTRLYRHLLDRQGDARQIQASDPDGFRNNLRLLDREGYEKLVLSLVDSAEFRRVHGVDALENMPVDPNVRRRPTSRDTRPGG